MTLLSGSYRSRVAVHQNSVFRNTVVQSNIFNTGQICKCPYLQRHVGHIQFQVGNVPSLGILQPLSVGSVRIVRGLWCCKKFKDKLRPRVSVIEISVS